MYGSLSSSHSSSAMNTLRARSRGSKRLNTRAFPVTRDAAASTCSRADHRGVLVVGDRRVVGPERARLEAELAARPQRQPAPAAAPRPRRCRRCRPPAGRRPEAAADRARWSRWSAPCGSGDCLVGRRRRIWRRSGASAAGGVRRPVSRSAAPAASDGTASAITRQTWRTSGLAARVTARSVRCRDAASGRARRSETRCPPA